MKYKTQNGWTKQKMKEQIQLKNNGSVARESGECVYETFDDNHCAVGCFIPENHPALYNTGPAQTILEKFPHLTKEMPLDVVALRELQLIHDRFMGSFLHKELFQWIDENVEDSV